MSRCSFIMVRRKNTGRQSKMENHSEDKAKRILEMYNMLMQGKIVSKVEMSASYGVSPRTIQRDIADIQCFLQEQ